MEWDEIKNLIIIGLLDGGMTDEGARELISEYDATFDCQHRSDSWAGCEQETSTLPKWSSFPWCRSCIAEKELRTRK